MDGEFIFREAEYRRVKLADMHPAEYNPRYDLKPGDKDYDGLKKSVIRHGLLQPIVWNEVTGNIVGGHQRYKILLEMGADEVICAVAHYETIEEEMAANIALNKAQGRFETKLLAAMFEQMDRTALDPQALGYTDEEIDHILSGLDWQTENDIFDFSQEPDKKPAMIVCPCCGRKFEEASNRVKDTGIDEEDDD